MGYLVGDYAHGGPSTWGALRSIIYNRTLSGDVLDSFGPHNVGWHQGFKTTEGNGFIRTDYSALYFNGGNPYEGPNFYASGLTASPAQGRFESNYFYGKLVNEDRAQLIGESVSLTSGSITITADAFLPPYYQVYPAYSALEVITSIGKMTAF